MKGGAAGRPSARPDRLDFLGKAESLPGDRRDRALISNQKGAGTQTPSLCSERLKIERS